MCHARRRFVPFPASLMLPSRTTLSLSSCSFQRLRNWPRFYVRIVRLNKCVIVKRLRPGDRCLVEHCFFIRENVRQNCLIQLLNDQDYDVKTSTNVILNYIYFSIYCIEIIYYILAVISSGDKC